MTETGNDSSSDSPPFFGHEGAVYAVAFSPDGTMLASGGADGTVRLWNAESGAPHREPMTGLSGSVLSVAFSPVAGFTPTRGRLVSAGSDGTIRLWKVRTGEPAREPLRTTDRSPVVAVAYSPDGRMLASAHGDGIRLWDTSAGFRVRHFPLTAHETSFRRGARPVGALAFRPLRTTLAVGRVDGSVLLLDVQRHESTNEDVARSTESLHPAAYSSDGNLLATTNSDGQILIQAPRTGNALGDPITARSYPVHDLAFDPHGTVLAWAGDQGLELLKLDPDRGLAPAILHPGTVYSVAFSPDGRTLASGGEDGIRLWDPRLGRPFAAPVTVTTTARPLAGVQADSATPEDLLGVQDDVDALADLIAARTTGPPLSIALIGEWGSGKSSLMLQVQDRVQRLAELSRRAPAQSAFASNVRQVRFNAWHYSDDHVWAGLVDHLFSSITAPDPTIDEPSSPAIDPDEQGDRVLGGIGADVDREIEGLRRRQHQADLVAARITTVLGDADRLMGAKGLRSGLGSPRSIARILAASGREWLGQLRAVRSTMWTLAGLAAVIVAGILIWRLAPPELLTWFSTAGGVLIVLATALRKLHRALLAFVEQRRNELDRRRHAARREAERVTIRLAELDASIGLGRYLDELSDTSAYAEHRGLFGQVAHDLGRLSAELARAHAAWKVDPSTEPPPLERTVLYIDDLDRCPPDRVVRVLEAVHLLLSLDLFVVVVAVDARWLIRSLEHHHGDLFKASDESSVGGPTAGPIDYLDKIFQVPYAVLPPGPAVTAVFLQALLPPRPDAETAPETVPETVPEDGSEDGPEAIETTIGTTDVQPAGEGPSPPALTETAGTADVRNDPPESTVPPDLSPPRLQVGPAEVAFMTALSPLLPTPRAAKRMVNLYRLVRSGIADARLHAFVSDEPDAPYRVVQALLAVLVGFPDTAQLFFRHILDADDAQEGILELLERLRGEQGSRWDTIGDTFAELGTTKGLPMGLAHYRRWCPAIARYSFSTQSLAGPAPGPE